MGQSSRTMRGILTIVNDERTSPFNVIRQHASHTPYWKLLLAVAVPLNSAAGAASSAEHKGCAPCAPAWAMLQSLMAVMLGCGSSCGVQGRKNVESVPWAMGQCCL